MGRGKFNNISGVVIYPAIFLLLLMLLCTPKPYADGFTEHRALVGLKLFRTLVTADLNLDKKINGEGSLAVAIIYLDDVEKAKEFQRTLQDQFSSVDQTPVQIHLHSFDELSKVRMPAAIYLAQPLKSEQLQNLIAYSVIHHIVLFSPFSGDVENGVLGGLSVQATVRPFINMHTLKKSKIEIKPFYLKVAKQYE